MYHASGRATGTDQISPLGKLFLVFLLIVICEGAVRKWITASLGSPLVFLRDVIAIVFIVNALKEQSLRNSALVQITLLWTVVVLTWSLAVNLVTQSPLWVLWLGIRFWLLYLWLAVCAAGILTAHDYRATVRLILVAGVLMTPLAVMQHFLPPGHIINSLPDTEEDSIFTLTTDIVRTTGTFSFTLGYTCFIALFSAVALSAHLERFFASKNLRAISVALAASVLPASLVSGSRASIAFFLAIASLAAFASFLVLLSGIPSRQKISPVLGWILAIALPVLFVFDRAVEATVERVVLANQVEDSSSRLSSILFGEEYDFEQFTLVGHGLGAATQAAALLSGAGKVFLLAETEPGRVMLEGGILGLIWLAVKMVLVIAGITRSIWVAKTFGDSTPCLLWGFVAYSFISWPISGQITAHAIAYVGLALALHSLQQYSSDSRIRA